MNAVENSSCFEFSFCNARTENYHSNFKWIDNNENAAGVFFVANIAQHLINNAININQNAIH